MIEATRKHLPLLISILVVMALAGPHVLAQAPGVQSSASALEPAAKLMVNVDRVDGKHAVGPKGNPAKRKNRLVAANSAGYLPNNITRATAVMGRNVGAVNQADNPVHWKQLKGVPQQIANGSYFTLTEPCGATINGGTGRFVHFFDAPRNWQYLFNVVPTGGTGWLYVEQVWTRYNAGNPSLIDIDVWVFNHGTGSATCNVRGMSFVEGISPAKAKARLGDIKTGSSRRPRD